ncbi:Imidazole glycerol phosphate synthase subunit HisH [archaeon HR06]|nr:Imidazole glycerol phosphate synthase subunit HisH [archaeon HR06]
MEGEVVKLPKIVKLPQMGWNTLKIIKESPFLDGIEDNSWVYFAHSYYPKTSKLYVVTETNYGISYPSSVEYKNIFGTQFHPEKSGKIGLRILENYVKFCKK